MFDYVGTFVLLVLGGGALWLMRRAWRTGRPALKWGGAIAAGTVALVALAVLGVSAAGWVKLNRTWDNPVPAVTVEVTPERIATGARFAPLCAGCHAPAAGHPPSGRNFLAGEGAPPVGRFWAPNLTPVHLAAWSDGEIIRAIREGVHRSGRSLIVMPSRGLRHLSDDDVQGIVAWLRSLPPVEPDTPPTRLNLLGAAFVALGPLLERQEPITAPVVAPPRGPTAPYGAYLTSLTCQFCHGEDLGGDPGIPAPGLMGAGAWTEPQFLAFIRTGRRPDGTVADSLKMPWQEVSRIFRLDDDLRAIHAYLATLGK